MARFSSEENPWEGIAMELHVSRRQAFNWRDEIVKILAEVIGWR